MNRPSPSPWEPSPGQSPGSSAEAELSSLPILTEARVSVIPLTCARCQGLIPAGQRYLRHTDRRRPTVVRFAECAGCARRTGRAGALGA